MDNLAIDALRGWRFRPATKDGKPVSAMIAVNVDFHLR
jgi:outer membrane biosynthesis protein TonB